MTSTANTPPSPDSIAAQQQQQQQLRRIFAGVDTDGNGRIDHRELQNALVNTDHSRFHPDTVTALLRMFDKSSNTTAGTVGGSVTFEEFSYLWRYLADWRKLYVAFDKDGSGSIDFGEFGQALRAFGYKLSTEFVHELFSKYSSAPAQNQSQGAGREMSFDMFVQACIVLKRITDTFKGFDVERQGVITIGFEEFLGASLRIL